MSVETILRLAWVGLQTTCYLACLSWLAWRMERRGGNDSFETPGIFALGLMLLGAVAPPFAVPLLLVTAGLSACAQMGAIKVQRSLQPSSPLMLFVAFTIICLLIFDWQTNHTPLAWPVENNWFVPAVVAVGAAALTATVKYHRTHAGRDLMLGAHQRWAISHWQPPRREWKRQELFLSCLAWIPVYALPLSTIGVLASTIFKDVTIAIMVARAVGPAGTVRLVGLVATISYMRVAVAFIFINSWASFLTDLCVIAALLVWLRQKSSRSPWEDAHVH